MRRTIFLKTFWSTLLIIVLVALFIILFSFRSIEKWHIERITGDLFRIARAMRPGIQAAMKDDSAGLDGFVKTLGKETDVRITVIRADGIVLADSLSDPADMENHGDRPEISKALRGDPSDRLRFSTTQMSSMLYLAVPIRQDDAITAVLRVSLFVEDIRLLLRDIQTSVIAVSAVVILISLIITFLISRGISNPVKQLAAAARRVAGGDYDIQVFPRGRGELAELTRSFNEMVSRQKELIGHLNRSRDELQTIIAAIGEGLLVLDHEGRIMLTNDNFNRLVEVEAPVGKRYWEVFRSSEFYHLVQAAMQSDKSQTGEIELSGRIFITSLAVLPSRRAYVATLHDITERKRLEAIKRDFVVNVSHELKTPLTSIKGFVEVLEDGLKGEKRRFLDIIGRNAERLINIVNDLLLLSGLEEKPFRLEPAEIDMKELVENALKLFDPALIEKNLYLNLEAAADLPSIRGDAFKLEDMWVNLIDNAVRYTEKGGITIRLRRDDPWLRCEIEDTGIGIDQDQQGRIFERFYVVDSSRSKASGGTGLGLSIVKHIVLLHNGKIEVESVPHQGTTFIIRLPLPDSF
jgi:two-component system phosphate regulon sensor histidine kinase PhoR